MEDAKTVVTEVQLEKLQKQQSEIHQVLTNIGVLESQKHSLLHSLAELNRSSEEFKKELEEEYGPVNINLATGEYTTVEENVNA
jgi:hypothetical protein